MIQWHHKGNRDMVGQWFAAREFDCRCGRDDCRETMIDDEMIVFLDQLREELDEPIRINCGFRCKAHQNELRGSGIETAVGVSQHELGRAVDISTGHHTGADLEVAARAVGFKAVGVARDWIHIDMRKDKVRRWSYK